jgi:hypothetical protein
MTTSPALSARYRRFNRRYFGGRLPACLVKIAYRDTASQCWREEHVIWIHCRTPKDEVASALLHEMVHLATGPSHGEAFRAELRRLAVLGSKAAAQELEREDWHLRAVRAARTVAPRLSFAEAREAIEAVAGKPPHGKDVSSGRAMLVWVQRAQGQPAAASDSAGGPLAPQDE